MERVARIFEVAFQIRRDELVKVQAFFVYFATIGMFYTVGTTVGDTLFLSRFGAGASEHLLPWLFLGVTAASVAVSWLYGQIERRVPRRTLIVATQLALAISLLFFRQAIRANARWPYFALAVWLEVCALLSIMLFFSYCGDHFTSRDARRLYGYIAGGLALGNVASGYAVVPLVRAVGPDDLLYACAGILLGGPACVLFISRRAQPVAESNPAGDETGGAAPSRAILANPYVRLIFAMTAAAIVVSVLLNYQFKITAVRQMHEAELAAFFGKLYGLSGAVQMAAQFALVPWLLGRFGIITGLLILPICMVAGSVACFLHPVVITCAATNGVRIALGETLDLPARELLFLPLPPRLRLRAQAMLGGILVPVGRGLGGALLLALSPLFGDVRPFALLSAGCAVIWLSAVYRLRPRYKQTLARSLQDRELTPVDLSAALAAAGGQALEDLLRPDQPGAAMALLELARDRPQEVPVSRLVELTASSEERVAVRALEALASVGPGADVAPIEAALEDPRAPVREAAVEALCRLANEDAVKKVVPLLEDKTPEVRAAAIAGCARFGGVEGGIVAYPMLDRLLRSESPVERAVAATALGHMGRVGFARICRQLLRDEAPSVRAAAVEAAAKLRDERLTLALADQIAVPELRARAVEGLQRLPDTAAPELAARLAERERPLSERLSIVQALAGIGGPRAASALVAQLAPSESLVVRVGVGESLCRLRDRGAVQLDGAALLQHRERLSEDMELVMRARSECGGGDPFSGALLLDHSRLQLHLLSCLFAADGRFQAGRVRAIESSLEARAAAARANALELVEATLPRQEGRRLMPLLGAIARAEPPTGRILQRNTSERLLASETWLRLIAFHHLQRQDGANGFTMGTQESKLYELLPTIAILKQTEFFKDVPANYLAAVAELAQPRTFYPGECILRDGVAADGLYVLSEGRVRIVMSGRYVWDAVPYNCLGDISLVDGLPETVTAEVSEEVRALRISAADFDHLIATQVPFARAILRKFAERLRTTAKAAFVDKP